MNRLTEAWERATRRVEAYLQQQCQAQAQPQKRLYEAMAYSLMAGGKRLRPFLTQCFCAVCGGQEEQALPAAAAVEMIHTYSLVHDDLPCMDNDDYRRGKPTNHKVYGEAAAVLAGDALLTDAFSVLASAPLPAATVCACVETLAKAAGSRGMVGGQVLDMEAEARCCTRQEVLDIQTRKTGALIRAACQLGVLCAGGDRVQLDAAGVYADALGLAFQIQDDILDVCGDAKTLGKATGVDGNKNTFVRLYGVDRCREMVAEQTEKAIDALSAFPDAQLLEQLARYLAQRDH